MTTAVNSAPDAAGKLSGGRMFVMKCGGSTLAELPDSFFGDLVKLQESGVQPVIVHGGGPAISENLGKLGIESKFVNGLRYTSEEVLDVVEMVLSGSINKMIVRRIAKSGGKALGLSGVDGGLLQAKPVAASHEVGLVGEVTGVNADLVAGVLNLGYMPVIAPVGAGPDGQRYNINADTAAGAVASELGVSRMIVVTDVPGIMKTVNGEKRVLETITVQQIEDMILAGEIYGGMIPKVRAAVDCISGKVKEVVIVNGAEPGVLGKVLSGEKIGTKIVRMQ
ncbi:MULTISPECIES: acetylglutamate kinase [Paenibacillus]|uniref:Acetylglutamate kinase n=1 Tax=Paenibacillus macerans TaxID=44252 RepID=A0A090ZUH4_PAEMA|nr:acetylglutamate kinase [Paenibacillus macerans]KFN07791.1 acetylglutamate kinase [Paenibacillus macerans]MBS5910749.1 acetylglutamate kinase [Paenibacillus macerans]MCY7560738.1 acetylglutamate kinase [Paenibacillus macerans]MEC0155154.1 acetylglutamate kinase [Paenibacillus macerans]MEC0332622.1 acetylglutamate kinase [Paenibacillus macerans]